MLTSVFGSHLELQTQRSCSLSSRYAPAVDEFVIEHQSYHFLWRWILISCAVSLFYPFYFGYITATIYSRFLYTVFLLSCFGLFFCNYKAHKESLVVIHGIGLVFSSTSGMWNTTTSFIAWENIEGIVLFEAFSWNRILFQMGVLVKNRTSDQSKQNIFPLFKDSAPRLECLQSMYRRLNVLFEQ